MKIVFPVKTYAGLDSKVYAHFGTAPMFVTADSDNNEIAPLGGDDCKHNGGQCGPVRELANKGVDCVVVGGIGGGALNGLRAAGIEVYLAAAATIRENLELLKAGGLQKVGANAACPGGGHEHGGGCAHHA
ncbi:MAG: NifB/NifX family molybdenum-iron cluster-binding protein [Elusimicrobiota bacterium]